MTYKKYNNAKTLAKRKYAHVSYCIGYGVTHETIAAYKKALSRSMRII